MSPWPAIEAFNNPFKRQAKGRILHSIVRSLGFRFYYEILLCGMAKGSGMDVICERCGKPIHNQWGRNNRHIICRSNPEGLRTRHLVAGTQHPLVVAPNLAEKKIEKGC